MKKLFSSFQPFNQPTPEELRKSALEDFERKLVEMETQASYATKMVEYYRENIGRLQGQLGYDVPCTFDPRS